MVSHYLNMTQLVFSNDCIICSIKVAKGAVSTRARRYVGDAQSSESESDLDEPSSSASQGRGKLVSAQRGVVATGRRGSTIISGDTSSSSFEDEVVVAHPPSSQGPLDSSS